MKIRTIGLIAYDKRGIKPNAIKNAILEILKTKTKIKTKYIFNKNIYSFEHKTIKTVEEDDFLKQSDLIVSLGGDGTFLSAARLVAKKDIPLIGVNMGGLGFLTDIPPNGISKFLSNLDKYAHVDKRIMLNVQIIRNKKILFNDIFLNDAVIKVSGMPKLSEMNVWIGDEFVYELKSDGLIVSTPTGSTAYSLAAGGPIVHPALNAAILTPIAPHSLTHRPIVSPMNLPIKVEIINNNAIVSLAVDGKIKIDLQANDKLIVSKCRKSIQMLKSDNFTFFKTINEKLCWGSRQNSQ